MSVELLNAENRNSRLSRAPRRCSFCREPGHNITRCISDRLTEFESACESEIRNIETQEVFKEWLIYNYSGRQALLKTFAISKFRVSSRTNLTDCIDLIAQYIFNTYKVSPEEELESDIMYILTNLRYDGQREPHVRIVSDIVEPSDLRDTTTREYMLYMTNLLVIDIFNNSFNQNIEEIVPTIKLNIASNMDCTLFDEDTKITDECSICLEEIEQCKFVKLNCNHTFCKGCVIKTIKTNNRSTLCCALCRSEISSITAGDFDVQCEISNAIA